MRHLHSKNIYTITQRVVYPDNEDPNDYDLSPSPPPTPLPDDSGLNDLDLNDNQKNNNSSSPLFDNMLPLSPSPPSKSQQNQQQPEINYHKQQIQYQQHQQIPDLLSLPQNNGMNVNFNGTNFLKQSPRGSRKPMHRYTRSDAAVLWTKQNALKYWQCSVCTFAENPIEYPVCKVCSALPPERPPSPNPPVPSQPKQSQPPQKSLYQQQQDALHQISNPQLHGNSNSNKHNIPSIPDPDEETDPLGHQKSASITRLPILDESISHKLQNGIGNDALYDFGFEDTNSNSTINSSKSKSKSRSKSTVNRPNENINNNINAAVASASSSALMSSSNSSRSKPKPKPGVPVPVPPQKAINPSLMMAKGGVGFNEASNSGKNIIRGLQPYEVPDLPPEKPESGKNQKKTGNGNGNANANTIASLGVDVNVNNDNKSGGSSGIGGFFGKVYNGWNQRRRAQSSENGLASPSPRSSGSRSRVSHHDLEEDQIRIMIIKMYLHYHIET